MQGKANKPEDVFEPHRSRRDPTTGCLIWLGARGGRPGYHHYDYGIIRLSGKNVGAHVAAYIATYGPVPEGSEVGHIQACPSKLCIEPTHLIAQTHYDNIQQMKGSMEFCRNGLHPWVPENIYIRKDTGRRMCKQCRKLAVIRHLNKEN